MLPGMTYTYLTQDEQYLIAILTKAGRDRSDIARLTNRHKSSIGREMKRNRGYWPKQAHAFSQTRMRACEKGPRVAAKTWAHRRGQTCPGLESGADLRS